MAFDIGARLLATLSSDFKVRLFDGQEIQSLMETSLTETEAWHQRKCVLTALVMMWFATMLVLLRDLSIPDVSRSWSTPYGRSYQASASNR